MEKEFSNTKAPVFLAAIFSNREVFVQMHSKCANQTSIFVLRSRVFLATTLLIGLGLGGGYGSLPT